MGRIQQFEDIEAWQQARVLANRIYDATQAGSFERDFALRDQINRASVSVMSNIAEGFERGGDREFARFLRIAKGSVGEVRSQLYCALDRGHVTDGSFDTLRDLSVEISRKLATLIRYLDAS
ncbi:MAG TPA: four helix bundle protein [Rubricoccaceae bacterium]|jgi:four helix bundle protein|nr:four helix bundle protein [Rubricoccaceae bacterium]